MHTPLSEDVARILRQTPLEELCRMIVEYCYTGGNSYEANSKIFISEEFSQLLSLHGWTLAELRSANEQQMCAARAGGSMPGGYGYGFWVTAWQRYDKQIDCKQD